MLNYNKIHSVINFDRTSKIRLAEYLGIPKTTFIHRLNKENLTPNDVYRIAKYFKKPIGYFFDEKEKGGETEGGKIEDPAIRYFNCRECIVKDKEIQRLMAELTQVQNELLEMYRGKKANSG